VTHFNHAEHLPPVGCPLLLRLPSGGHVRAERTGFIADKSREMEYRMVDGSLLRGRFDWTYP